MAFLAAFNLQPLRADDLATQVGSTETLAWRETQIEASRVEYLSCSGVAGSSLSSDTSNLFVVIESDGHAITILDGNRLEPIHHLIFRSSIQGDLQFDSSGRYVFITTQDGWVRKFDLHELRTKIKIRVGVEVSDTALSADDRFMIVGNDTPHNLVMLNATNLTLVKTIPTFSARGKSSQIANIQDASFRSSFVVTLKDAPQIWEINYEAPPPAGFGNWVHDYRKESGEATIALFPIRRLWLKSVVEDFFFDREYVQLIGFSNTNAGLVVDMDLGRKVVDLAIFGIPHLTKGTFWRWKTGEIAALPDALHDNLSIFNTETWKRVAAIPAGEGITFVRSHDRSPYAWVGGSTEDANTLLIIDKQTLKAIKNIRVGSDQKPICAEFSRDGRKILVGTIGEVGEVVVYDTIALTELMRIPIVRPKEIYNVFNASFKKSAANTIRRNH